MAHDSDNIKAVGDYGTTAQALSLNHATRYSGGEIEAVFIDGHFVPVDSIEFADYASSVTWTAEDYDAYNYL